VVEGQYAAIERGDLGEWASAYASNALLFGTDPSETFVGREAIGRTMEKAAQKRMRAEVHRTYRSTGKMKIGVAPDGRAAWVDDEIEYTLTSTAGTTKHIFQVTELLGEEGGRWSILASHYAVAISDAVAERTIRRPQDPVPSDVASGAEQIAQLVGADPAVKRSGGVLAALSPSKSAGWAAYTGTRAATIDGREAELPVRVLDIFFLLPEGWKKVASRVSIPVPD
jgi:hypothetical protein